MAGFGDERRNFVKSFGLSRNENEDRRGGYLYGGAAVGVRSTGEFGPLGEKAAINRDEQFLFAVAGTAADPDRAVAIEAERGGQCHIAVNRIGDVGGVPFNRADNVYAIRGYADQQETVGDDLVLCTDPFQSAEHPPCGEANVLKSPGTALGQATIGDGDRDIAAARDGHEVVPDFEFHQHDGGRRDAAQHARNDKAEVERETNDVCFAVQFDAAGVAGVRGGGEDEIAIRAARTDFIDQRARGVHLAERDGMNPDAWTCCVKKRYETAAL